MLLLLLGRAMGSMGVLLHVARGCAGRAVAVEMEMQIPDIFADLPRGELELAASS